MAEERHFGRAAARLRIAQPPLSRQIQALERELGFPLLERNRRRVELTPAGEVFLLHVRKVFEAVELAEREARRAFEGASGRIVVGYPSTFAYSGLPELVRAFHAKYPDVEVVLRELPPQRQVEALREDRIDVGFIRAPFEEPGLRTELMRSEPLVAAIPLDHPLAGRKMIPLSLLAKEPFIMFPRERGQGYFDHLMRLCHEAGFIPRIVQEAPQLDIVSLVAAGLGVALVPSSIRKIRRAGIVLVPLVGSPRTKLLVAWSTRNASAVLREFLEIARKHASR